MPGNCRSMSTGRRPASRTAHFVMAWSVLALSAFSTPPAPAQDAAPATYPSPIGRHRQAAYAMDVGLSADDRAYLAGLPPLRIAYDPEWAPLSFLDDRGQLAGLTADYLAYFEAALHVRFELLPSASWQEAMKLADSGQADIVAAAEPGSAFAVPYTLTTSYVTYPTVVVTRDDAAPVRRMEDLWGKHLAITRGEDFGGYFSGILNRFRIVPVGTDREGLQAVARGDAFATVGNLGVLDPLIRKEYAGILRIAMPTGHQQSLHFAVAARYHRLAGLMDKTLAAIPPAEKERIQNTWMSTHVQYGVSKQTLWHVLGPIAAVVLAFIAALGIALHYVRAEVKQRRRSERALRMQSERLAQATAEAEEASRVKDAFLATMSHEIRTPMSGVIGVLDLMHREHMRPDDRHLLDMARGAASSLMRILNDILDFARHQGGELRLEMAAIGIREVIDDVVGLFAHEAQRKGLRFDVVVDARVGLRHRGDGHRIGQMLTNVVSNAMKFTDTGAVVVRVEDGGMQDASQKVRFVVEDSGIGISPEQQARLFHPFSQADTSTSRRYGGTGLGLAICRQLAESMGGSISLDSALGEGTRIAITIPLEPAPIPDDTGMRREAWLSVSDPLVREAIGQHLAALDATVRTAGELKTASAEPLLIFRDTELAMLDVERAMVIVNLTRSHASCATDTPEGALSMGVSPVLWRDVVRAHAMLTQDVLDRQAAREVAQAAAMVAPLRPVATLIVEDQPLNQELLLRQMASVGVAQCDLANNGIEALQRIGQKRYQLIVTDCAMPVMGGEELIRRIRQREREDPSLGHALVVVLTANVTLSQRQLCLDAGADDVLIKPVSRERLSALLDGIVPPANPSDQVMAPFDGPLLDELHDTLRRDAQALNAALARRDTDDARSAAHRLLGCARWFGLDPLAEAAEALEDALGGMDDTTQAVDRLMHVLRVTLSPKTSE